MVAHLRFKVIRHLIFIIGCLISFLIPTLFSSDEGIFAVPEGQIVETPPEKTFDEEISYLSEKYAVNVELALKIIECESQFQPHATGSPVIGEDIGYFQINTFYHRAKAEQMKLDLQNWHDNLEYGFWLLSTAGTDPWLWSQSCWQHESRSPTYRVFADS